MSEQEHRVLQITAETVYDDADVPYGVVVARACRALLAEKEAESSGVHL